LGLTTHFFLIKGLLRYHYLVFKEQNTL
jgi:hypothetical protein